MIRRRYRKFKMDNVIGRYIISQIKESLNFFKLLFIDKLINEIVYKTNNYGIKTSVIFR